jgi:predicted nucleic acid-binding Zn ribbon protein
MVRGKTRSVGDFVGGIVRAWERRAGGPIERIIIAWDGVVGRQIAASTRPVEMEGTTLVVDVRDAIWRDQLARFYTKQIVSKLNAQLGAALVRAIRFRVGRDTAQWEKT